MAKVKNRFNIDKLNQVSGGAMRSAPHALQEKKKQDERNSYEIVNIPVDKLQPMSYNREVYNVDDLDFLGATISQYGLAQPLVVQKQPGSDMYNIVAGERRYQSYLKSKQEGNAVGLYPNGLPCHVYPEDMSIVDIKIMLIVTNATSRARTADTQRKELEELVSLFNEAKASGITIGFSLQELAQNHLNIAKRQYQRYMSAMRVIPELKSLADDSDIHIASGIGAKPESVQMEIYRYLQEHHCSLDEAYRVINEEYDPYRQQLQEARKLVKTLQGEKQALSQQLRNKTATQEENKKFEESVQTLREAKKNLQRLEDHAGDIIHAGIQKKQKQETLSKLKESQSETSQPQTTNTSSLPSIHDAIQQMNGNLNAIGMQMKLCNDSDLAQLQDIRDRINNILSLHLQNNATHVF